MVLDELIINLQVDPPNEAEILDFTISGAYHSLTESGVSAGGAVSLDAIGMGHYISFAPSSLRTDIFNLTVRAKTWNDLGLTQVSLGDAVSSPFTTKQLR